MCLRFLMKLVLFIINFLFSIIGLGFIAVGTILILVVNSSNDYITKYVDVEELTEYIDKLDLSIVKTIATVIIAIGCVIFFIAFCGCCGACCENKCMLITYAVCMGVLAAFKIYIIVQIFGNLDYYRRYIESLVDKTFEEQINLNQTSSLPSVPEGVNVTEDISGINANNQYNATFGNLLETALHCCGTTGPDYYNFTNDLVPPTCCLNTTSASSIPSPINSIYDININQTVSSYECRKSDAFQDGCSTMIGYVFGEYATIFGNGIVFVVVAEIVEMLFAILLSTNCCKVI